MRQEACRVNAIVPQPLEAGRWQVWPNAGCEAHASALPPLQLEAPECLRAAAAQPAHAALPARAHNVVDDERECKQVERPAGG